MKNRTMQFKRHRKQGLILLIVLGMLAMFTLLAVTYVVVAGSSRSASEALRVKARNGNLSIVGTARRVLKDAVRGSNNQKSPFYGTSIIGDVFGPNPIRTQFGPYVSANSARRFNSGTGINLVKLSVNPAAFLNGPLSDLENEYNSRILTVQEGPLSGQSFRILKYVGFVRSAVSSPADINIDPTPWSFGNYVDPQAAVIQYSVLIDLNEVIGAEFNGEYTDNDSTVKSVSQSLDKWINTFGISSLFFFKSTPGSVGATTNTMIGYKFQINDAPFNSPGIGLEDIASTPTQVVDGFGNLDGRRLLKPSGSNPPIPRVPLALLSHYDYLQDPKIMATNTFDGSIGVDGIGVNKRDFSKANAYTQSTLNGWSNEGFDVPDFRDNWLANQSYAGGQYTITPSYHRPEVINYISNLFGSPSSLTSADVQDMLRLIDASTARVLSYPGKNPAFRENDPKIPPYLRLPQSFTWTGPTQNEIAALRNFVRTQIIGPWDVDNDGDGIADSVWIDPGMPTVFAPDGRRLRPMAAILTEDLDGRVNLNTAGDRVQGNSGFNPVSGIGYDVRTSDYYKRKNQTVPQGFGYGPAEISLTALFQNNYSLLMSESDFSTNPTVTNHFSFFDELFGARRYSYSKIVFPYVTDRVPGAPRGAAYPEYTFSALSEREFHLPTQHDRLPGMPIARRGAFGMTYDRNGNPAFVNPNIVDGNPYNPGNVQYPVAFPNETLNDRYESAAMENPTSDDPLGLRDLETILRRFDEDVSSLPTRLRDKLAMIPGYGIMDGINREITVRSGELRYPNLATAMKASPTPTSSNLNSAIAGQAPGTATPSYLRYIQMLHSQRYRNQSFPPIATDDPIISYAAMAELFPMDFSKGLRMDLNRPFGDGFDNDGDGQVDEPQELNLGVENEIYPGAAADPIPRPYTYKREIKLDARKLNAQIVDSNANANAFPSQTRNRLGSRQILARNLYCLAQLIIPKDYEFPGMTGVTNALVRTRIRATAIAQWAVNVVDFRDADAAMTRFEFDILPFGVGYLEAQKGQLETPISTASQLVSFSRSAYWAPDRIQHIVNGTETSNGNPVTIPNKAFVGVVWGMEMPELLLTESLALHDKRLRDTDFDTSGLSREKGDEDLDQYRFPQASLFLELYNPRTTAAATNALIPGVPSSLYDSSMQLELDKLAPSSGATWGSQPVWRIAISEMYDAASAANHPQDRLSKTTPTPTGRTFATTTHQWSTELVPGGTTRTLPAKSDTALTGATDLDRANTALFDIEHYIGSGLGYDHSVPTATPPQPILPGRTAEPGFERFIWFTSTRPSTGQNIPDIQPSRRAIAGVQQASVFTSQSGGARLSGGSYLVIGPRSQTNIGSLTHNQFTGYQDPTPELKKSNMGSAITRPILSPSYQRIDLATSNVKTYLFNNTVANSPWSARLKTPVTMICGAPAPSGWSTAFPNETAVGNINIGIGLNISFPPPVAGSTIWQPANLPTKQLNLLDVPGSARPDNTPGFGSTSMPPDSWVDLSGTVNNVLPDEPIDFSNPLLTGKLNTGTYENVRAAYLQRLADPEFGYDPVTNPYITVDWMSIDLTVFNGESPLGSDPNDTPVAVMLQSRFKNGVLSPLATGHDVTINNGISYHSPITGKLKTSPMQTGIPSITVPGITPPVNPESFFPYQLGYDKAAYPGNNTGNSATTLGYCNVGYFTGAPLPAGSTQPSDAQLSNATSSDFDGFGPPLNDPSAIPSYQGAPARMAGVTWFNRPFASPYELMMVPLTSPGTFGLHHSAYASVQNREMFGFVPSYQTTNAWNVDLSTSPALPNPPGPPSLNSYWAKPEALAPGTVRLADWPLILEFVETQAPFIDANKNYRPDSMSTLSPSILSASPDYLAERFLNSIIPAAYTRPDIGPSSNVAVSEPYTVRGPSFLAPFNKKPSYVAAGKINLNTISFDSAGHSRALKAIEHCYLAGERGSVLDSLAASFVTARQGYSSASPNKFFVNLPSDTGIVHPAMDPNFPTRFVGAYRPAMSSNLAPALADPIANQKMRGRFGVESTLLRSLDPDTNTLAVTDLQNSAIDRNMLFQATQVETTDRLDAVQPFVRMQRAMRLPNLVTNQSNVFAVWVTVSLYEYDPITGFGNEYVGETGLPERERQFFIVDRTIPVGFKPGEDLNTDRAVLMQRKLP